MLKEFMCSAVQPEGAADSAKEGWEMEKEKAGWSTSYNYYNYCTVPREQKSIMAGLILRLASFTGRNKNLPKEIEAQASVRGNTVVGQVFKPQVTVLAVVYLTECDVPNCTTLQQQQDT